MTIDELVSIPPIAVPTIALLVEDDEVALETRRDLFRSQGFLTITANSFERAIAELSASATIDLVVTDIDLGYGPDEKSGFDVARSCRETHPDVPIVAYSGIVEEDDIPSTEWELFKSHVTNKAPRNDTIKAIRSRIDSWKALAEESRSKRVKLAMDELSKIYRKYGKELRDVRQVSTFLPGLALPVRNSILVDAELTPDALLSNSDLELVLIGPSQSVSLPDGILGIRATIAAWVYAEGDCYVAELVEHPSLFFDGENKEAAIEGLLILMSGFHADFRDGIVLSHSLEILRTYLNLIFE